MKRLLIVLVLFIFQSLCAQKNEEFRATWVITWEHIAAGSSSEANKALVQQILDDHKKANMNAVVWQVRQGGTAYYSSSYEPWGFYAGYKHPGYDPLAYAIEQAHARGLELHAWMNVFESRDTSVGSPASTHPEWVCRDQDGRPMTDKPSLSPGLAQVREYLVKVAMEIVRNYDIDGLHLDYVRWNEFSSSAQFAKVSEGQRFPEGAIGDDQVQDLLRNAAGRYLYDVEHPYSAGVPAGFSTWEEWWRWSVTEFVRALHDSIQAVKPWVRLSPAALGRYNWGGWQGYDVVYQDAALWFNQGYIEQIMGMHYHWTTGQEFYDILTGGCPACWSQYIQPGIAAGRLYSVGPPSYILDQEKIWNRHPEIVARCREVPWVDGFQFFSYASWRDRKYWEEARSTFFSHQTKVRATKLIVSVPPEPPTLALAKIDSLHYQITVSPAATSATPHRFAIYRSPDENLDVDQDEIIDIHFGEDAYSFTDTFTGVQDFNGRYLYFATCLDRYWNESEPSNAQLSDSIPSFAPAVVASTPAEGDTVTVNTTVLITFSKTMDVSSFPNAVSFNPAVGLGQLLWSDDHKTVTIVTTEDFEYATDYTVIVAALATDMNGKPLDGNGDGSGGDPFLLHFRTKEVDTTGPTIVFSYPDYRASYDTLDVEDVFVVVFDEIIDPNSVSATNVILTQAENRVALDYLLTTVNERSVLSVQPLAALKPQAEYLLVLSAAITDTLGNPMAADFAATFWTSPKHYTEKRMVEDFSLPSDWKQPHYSGSTTGIVVSGTEWSYNRSICLPVPRPKRSASLRYEWDPASSSFLIREYLNGGPAREVLFDTSFVLQCYVFGDGSNNKFRFAVDDSTKDQAAFHEVSKWTTIDWYGWRLVEWRLNDSSSVGEWIGDGVLNGPSLRFDSFQLTHEAGAAVRGNVYFDNLRLVKKSAVPVTVADYGERGPAGFVLYQNYPNPFNPVTTIAFDLPKPGTARLVIYDILGREITRLVNAPMTAGRHEVPFDASPLASGVYYYRLEFDGKSLTKELMLLK